MLYQLSYASAARTGRVYQKRYENCKGLLRPRSTLGTSVVENPSGLFPAREAILFPISNLAQVQGEGNDPFQPVQPAGDSQELAADFIEDFLTPADRLVRKLRPWAYAER